MRKKPYISKLPEVLVLCLQRYNIFGGRCAKNADKVEINQTINLDKYVMEEGML